jgi:ribose transport system substrate-binding protein
MQQITPCRLGMLLVLTIMSLAGCGKPAARTSSRQQQANTRIIGVSLASVAGPWRLQVKTDLETAVAKRPDMKLLIVDADDDAERQQSQLREFHNRAIDALIVSPKDSQSATDTAAEFFEAGTPVVVLERALIGDRYSTYIAADPVQIGEEAGKWMAERLGGKGNLMELRGPVDSIWAEQLHTAWRAQLRNPGFHIVSEGRVNRPATDPAALMRGAFSYIKKIDAVFAYDDSIAYAAFDAARAAGRSQGTLFVGVGGLRKLGVGYVSQGILAATVVNPTGGTEAIDAVAKLLRGEKVPKRITPLTRVITKEDIVEDLGPPPESAH